jgi:hypothetical protein
VKIQFKRLQNKNRYMRNKILFLFLSLVHLACCAVEPLARGSVVLLQPESVFQQRIPSTKLLASYIGAVESAAASAVMSSVQKPQANGFLVLAVRPGQKSKAWLDFTPSLPLELADAILAKVEAVPALSVTEGVIAFGLELRMWGAVASSKNMPAPAQWKEVVKKVGRPLETSVLIELVWPE